MNDPQPSTPNRAAQDTDGQALGLSSPAKDSVPAIGKQEPPSGMKRSWAKQMVDAIFGFDFFISYGWIDGKDYARQLARRLEQEGFDCFLDVDDFHVGDDVNRIGQWTLRRTTRLVLVATPGALKSQWVFKELEYFTETGKQVLPIEFGNVLATLPANHEMAPFLPPGLLRVLHDRQRLAMGPSDAAIEQIKGAFEGERQAKKRLRWVQRVALALFALFIAAVGFAITTVWQRNRAQESEREANLRLSDVSWQLAQQARGAPFSSDDVSPIKATLHLYQAAEALEKAGKQEEVTNTVFAADVSSAHLIATMVHGGEVTGAALSPDGTRILSWGRVGKTHFWEASTGKPVVDDVHDYKTWVNGGLFSQDGRSALTWEAGGQLWTWDPVTGLLKSSAAGHNGGIHKAVFSKDGQRVLSSGWDGFVKIWDTHTGQPLVNPMEHKKVSGARFSPDERHLLSWAEDGSLRLWEAATGQVQGQPMQHGKAITGALFEAEGLSILSWSEDGTMRLWDATTGTEIRPAMKHDAAIHGAVFSSDGKRILSWSEDATARLWSTEYESVPPLIFTHPKDPDPRYGNDVVGAIFSPDEKHVLSWGLRENLMLWDTNTGALSRTFSVKSARYNVGVEGAIFSEDGTRILSWSSDGTVRQWDANNGTPVGLPIQHKQGVNGACFSADRNRVLTWSKDGAASLWNAATGAPLGKKMRHEQQVNGSMFLPGGSRILTWSDDGTLRLWNAAMDGSTGQPMKHSRRPKAIFSVDESRILSWSEDGTARQWDASTGYAVGRMMQHEGPVTGAMYVHGGKHILSGTPDGRFHLWAAEDGSAFGKTMDHGPGIAGVWCSPDMATTMTYSDDGLTHLWDTASGASKQMLPKMELPNAKDQWIGATHRPDGRQILHWSKRGTMLLRDIASGKPAVPPLKHDKEVRGAIFNTDGSLILSWAKDSTLRLWKTADGTQCGSSMKHKNWVGGAAFSPDESRILSWSIDGSASLWETATTRKIGKSMTHGNHVHEARLSKSGKNVLIWAPSEGVRVFDVGSNIPRGLPMKPQGTLEDMRGATFTGNGERVLTWSNNGMVCLWNVYNSTLVASFNHDEPISEALLARDEKVILTVGSSSIRLWNASFNAVTPLALRRLEFAVRSASVLEPNGTVRILSESEWKDKQAEWTRTVNQQPCDGKTQSPVNR